MAAPRFTLRSPYSPEECAARLTARIKRYYFAFPSARDSLARNPVVVGKATSQRIALRQAKCYNNAFQTLLTARLHPEGTGTVISGKLDIHPFVKAASTLWMLPVLAFPIVALCITLTVPHRGDQTQSPWPIILLSPIMPAVGYGFFRLCRYLARDEGPFLHAFLIQTLDAREET